MVESPKISIRQPIVCVLGHIDHGKTTLLDSIRGTTVAEREAGRITQHIGATEIPADVILKICSEVPGEHKIMVPGLLFIDTPGHESFVLLRSRGGALADMAILVVDIIEGVKPQTIEALNTLKRLHFLVQPIKLIGLKTIGELVKNPCYFHSRISQNIPDIF